MKKFSIALNIIFLIAIAAGTVIYFINSHEHPELHEIKGDRMLPRVLLLTTGNGSGQPTEGVITAVQTFNKLGAYVQIANRNILLEPERLAEYSIMLLSTAVNYHDADRRYSLTYLSDEELTIIRNWVKNGGMLIAGDNMGRNMIDGTDRAAGGGSLSPENWIMAECFGVTFAEKNMRGYDVHTQYGKETDGFLLKKYTEDEWTLVVDSVMSSSLDTIAFWENDGKTSPASVLNRYGKGKAVYLSTSYMLHPSNAGGFMSLENIEKFYSYLLSVYHEDFIHTLQLLPWKNGAPAALTFTFNADGSSEEVERLFSFYDERGVIPTFFVHTPNDTLEGLISDYSIPLGSSGYGKQRYDNLSYSQIRYLLQMNETAWQKDFKGFKFPYSRSTFWGLYILNELGYVYESSIGADNLHSIAGSVYPYNIPISMGNYYSVLDLIEISPADKDDYFFFGRILSNDSYSDYEKSEDAAIFAKYLKNYWNYAVKEYGGVMTYVGHPMYTAHNEITMSPLDSLITYAERDSAWITTTDEIAEHWKVYSHLKIFIDESENMLQLTVSLPQEESIEGLTLRLDDKPESVTVEGGDYRLTERGDSFYLIMDVRNATHLRLSYE